MTEAQPEQPDTIAEVQPEQRDGLIEEEAPGEIGALRAGVTPPASTPPIGTEL